VKCPWECQPECIILLVEQQLHDVIAHDGLHVCLLRRAQHELETGQDEVLQRGCPECTVRRTQDGVGDQRTESLLRFADAVRDLIRIPISNISSRGWLQSGCNDVHEPTSLCDLHRMPAGRTVAVVRKGMDLLGSPALVAYFVQLLELVTQCINPHKVLQIFHQTRGIVLWSITRSAL